MARIISFFAVGMLLTTVASADIIIDFQSLEREDALFETFGSDYTEDGFVLSEGTGGDLGNVGTLESRYSGSTAVVGASPNALYVLTKQGGGSFDLESIDLAEFSLNEGGPTVSFTGILSDGGVTSQSFMLDGISFAPETFTFNSSFDSIVALVWNQSNPGHQFDNIVITQIPEPTSAAVLMGLSVLVLRRRR